MDFTKKDTRAAAEKPRLCHLRDQDTGEYLYDADGSPIGPMVKGTMARSVQEALRVDAQEKLADAKGKTKEEQVRAFEDIQREFAESAAKLTTGFVGVQRGDADAMVPDDCLWFYDLNMFSVESLISPKPGEWQGLSFAQQVLEYTKRGAHFLGNV